jgi:hypothetical protein
MRLAPSADPGGHRSQKLHVPTWLQRSRTIRRLSIAARNAIALPMGNEIDGTEKAKYDFDFEDFCDNFDDSAFEMFPDH